MSAREDIQAALAYAAEPAKERYVPVKTETAA